MRGMMVGGMPGVLNFGIVFPVGQVGIAGYGKEGDEIIIEYAFIKKNKSPIPKAVTVYAHFEKQDTKQSHLDTFQMDISKGEEHRGLYITKFTKRYKLFGDGKYIANVSAVVQGPFGIIRRLAGPAETKEINTAIL